MTHYRSEHNQSLTDGNRDAVTKKPCVYCGRLGRNHIKTECTGLVYFECKPKVQLGKRSTKQKRTKQPKQ